MFGVVEGFYGPMWDWIDRLSILEFMGRIELNLYIYGPKWDSYHREWWRIPYNENFMNNFALFVDAGRRYGVDVSFALSPGLDIDYSSMNDLNLLLRKFGRIMDLGVDVISLFLDDIPPIIRGKGFKTLAEAQAKLVNRVYDELKPRALIFCPTFYYGVKGDYLRELGELLDPGIYVMWTGMYVCPYRMSSSEFEMVTSILGRKPFVWDNYPVNDYFICRGIVRLHLGPIKNRPSNIRDLVSGYTANPANQVEVSKFALYSIARMIWEGENYDADRALREAIGFLVNRSARYWFERFVEFNRATFMDLNENVIVKDNADEVLELIRQLRETLTNLKLLKEIEPVLKKMESIARYAKGEHVGLSYRVQTSGEYNPPIPADRMKDEIFGIVARRMPWYVKVYPSAEWW